MTFREFIKKPYHLTIVPHQDGFMGYVAEFPGCVSDTESDNYLAALCDLVKVIEAWLAEATAAGNEIPEPKE